MQRSGLICKSLPATLFLTVALLAGGLRAQDLLSALPPKPAEHPVTPAKEVEAANAAPTTVIEVPTETAEPMRKEEANRPMPAARPGAQGAEAFRARMLEMFDKNKDGRLDDEERAAAKKYAEEHGMRPDMAMPGSREELLKRFDKNGDGKLDSEERAAMQAALRERGAKPAETMRAEMLRRFDRNANGKIDDDEMAAIDAMHARLVAMSMLRQRFDKNGDGKIDDEEWAAARGPLQQWLNEAAKK